MQVPGSFHRSNRNFSDNRRYIIGLRRSKQRARVSVYRTDSYGSIVIVTDGRSFTVTTAKVLLLGKEEIKLNIPLKLLPQGTKEGSLLQVEFKLTGKAKKNSANGSERIAGKLERFRNKGKEEAVKHDNIKK